MTTKKQTYPESGLWKDYFKRPTVGVMAEVVGSAYPKFDRSSFAREVFNRSWPGLELKQRLHHIATVLGKHLPSDYPAAIEILVAAAPRLPEFDNWVLTSYIELFGLKDFDVSIKGMELLTPHGTAEFAVRPFMTRHTSRMLPVLRRWSRDANEHIRRLAAEGSRPRGVWVEHIKAFKEDPTAVLKLLEILKADPSLYVRKAVANNLNDISRDNPEAVIATARLWYPEGNAHTRWIVKRGCRTLIEEGAPQALAILGFTPSPKITVTMPRLSPKKVRIGGKIDLSVQIISRSASPQKLVIDYAVHYLKANGAKRPKLFKLAEKQLAPRQTISLTTSHVFRQLSTRQLYRGEHKLDLIVNGQVKGSLQFELY